MQGIWRRMDETHGGICAPRKDPGDGPQAPLVPHFFVMDEHLEGDLTLDDFQDGDEVILEVRKAAPNPS